MIIDSIQNGIVIDHITAGKAMELYNILGLDKLDCTVAILKNVTSGKLGRKDIIKIDREMELAEWNGASLDEGTYCYVIFNRKEQTFEMYQKFDSMYARYITGSFSIENNPYLGYIISGVYDYGNGDWNNKYIVTDLLESGSMTWTSKDDESDVNKYIRCEKVPEEIIAEAKVDKDEE